MDRPDQGDQGARTDEQAVATDGAAASAADRETESGFMNRLIRGVSGIFGAGDRDSSDRTDQEPQDAAADAKPAVDEPKPDAEAEVERQDDPDRVVLTRAELAERERQWQATKDREILQFKRESAATRAEQGDLGPIREMAEKGDRWAQRQLAEHGDTWALGEVKAAELREQQQAEGMGEQIQTLASHFDGAYLEPLLAALPDQTQAAKIRSETVGIDGRAAAVKTVLEALATHHRAEGEKAASAKLLSDEGFVKKLLQGDSAFRKELLKNPVTNKQLRAMFRNELDEPDLNPGSGPGRGGERESDVMNDAIRAAWQSADDRGDDERAAGAGARNGRMAVGDRTESAVHRDVLDDDA